MLTRKMLALVAGLAATAGLALGCRSEAPQIESPYRATSTVRDVMQSLVSPSAEGLWKSVGTVSNAQGTVNLEPKTDEDWAAVRRHAVALIESTNLLLIPGRHIAPEGAQVLKADDADPGAELPPAEIEKRVAANWQGWTAMAHALHDAGMTILKEIDNKDVAGLERTGSDLDAVCESCHLTFWYPPTSPVSK